MIFQRLRGSTVHSSRQGLGYETRVILVVVVVESSRQHGIQLFHIDSYDLNSSVILYILKIPLLPSLNMLLGTLCLNLRGCSNTNLLSALKLKYFVICTVTCSSYPCNSNCGGLHDHKFQYLNLFISFVRVLCLKFCQARLLTWAIGGTFLQYNFRNFSHNSINCLQLQGLLS